ncbi:laminin subunit alpha-3 isoform X1 [Oryzias latipes]
MARGTVGAHLLAVFLTSWATVLRDAGGQEPFNDLTGFSLNPPYFNLAEGIKISASATCGQDEAGAPRQDLYCKLVGGPNYGLSNQHIQGQFCDHCNSADPSKAHPATNAIDGTERWWQSPPLSRGSGYNEVNVTLDLGQLFHVAYVLIKFANSPRPDLWVLERSVDNGRTFTPWQFFAHSKRECIERFGKPPNARVLKDDDQLCTTEYSRIIPLENGEIVVSLINGRPGSKNFTYSPVLQQFTKATNIRLRFLRTSTLLGHLISKAQRDPSVTRRYYYSIKDISVGGRCVCHGHAQVCGAGRNPGSPSRLQCECQHNTCGESCDRCCPGFNQKPWRAATADSPNECRPCQCFSHASDCYYDPEVERRGASLDTFGRYSGGGVCVDCQHNTAGVNCERCAEGFFRPYDVPPESHTGCISCSCDDRTASGCEMGSGRCVCRPQFAGENCDRCADGYYLYPQCISYPVRLTTTESPAGPIVEPTACPLGYFDSPNCQPCSCDYRGTVSRVCDASGRCLCREGVDGERCDRCRRGYYSFPNCQVCRCNWASVSESLCDPSGRCLCLPNFTGLECDECAPGFYGFPDCAACQCSQKGSYDTICNPTSGQCLCLPGVVGQQCDQCASGLSFPQCSEAIRGCNIAGTEISDPQMGSCRCLPNVEGPLCDRCKQLYWNLATDNPHGCTECHCDLKGTLSGVGECEQKSGQCHCKPHVCGHACDSCKEGYFLMQKKDYFGCETCQCDVGGAIGMGCDQISGQCQCRANIIGRTCSEPAPSFYFPTLHQLKFEIEDGTTPNARPVRFGYDPKEFPDFSWRGYAIMSPAQSEVRVTVHVDPKDGRQNLFRVVLQFINPSSISVSGSIKATHSRGISGTDQMKEIVFPPSSSPSFLTVPGEGFAEPFALNPGNWIIHIKAEGVLLDYLVLLPREYYEASLLQAKITQPCSYLPTADTTANCLLYKHIAMDAFSSVLGTQGRLTTRRGRRKRRQARVHRPTSDHPEMAVLNGRQSLLELILRVPHPGSYVLVLEYASEVETIQTVNILISDLPGGPIVARVNIYTCAFSTLCRSAAVDSKNQVARLELVHRTEILLQTSTTSFLLYKLYAVPAEEFSTEYIKPKELCVSTHGRFTEDSRHCILRAFEKPPSALILYAAHDGQPLSTLADAVQREKREDRKQRRQSGLFSVQDPHSGGVLLKFPQTEISFAPSVPLPGRYVVVIHYHQPEHISFPVEVRIDAGREWKGLITASFCPAVSGCRDVVIADARISLDFDKKSWPRPTITVITPPKKTLILDYILLVPDSIYTPDLLKEKPLDKSEQFKQLCPGEGFLIEPRGSSIFCKAAVHSLVAAYNDGALPCDCNKSGSTGSDCSPVGGQCPCRPHIIGRQCTKCATGYYGFPYCRPCECGRRLCDEVTGRCICPPQTVRPACDVCQNLTFSYHPLLGCENCACSPTGISTNAGPHCDRVSGQCSCKPYVGGRQCDRCAAGYYRFPNCLPCDCHKDGVTSNVCHPDTGECLCKRNVAGVRCDVCREGSFYFDPSNPQGCTSCFCFGASDRCQSSNKRRGKFVEMRDWRLESPAIEEVSSALNTASNTVVADVQELPPTVQSLYWVAPRPYLGNRVFSYGGFLTYQSKSFGIPKEGMALIDRRPDVVLTGQNMNLIHVASQIPLPDRLFQGRVEFLEGNWRHAGTNRPVSREELMMVLAGLVGLRIRALYFAQSQRLTLGEVGLEEATNSGTGSPANTVEDCFCPPQYSGGSCEKCSAGFYRDAIGSFLGRCVPCQCNGLASECEDKTGRCLNCRYNTAGDRCEHCKEGYYGNAALRTCRACPCPFSESGNNFAVGCREVNGNINCVCKPGYTGERCERCSSGYFGDPMSPGGRCQPCNCNGNGNNCDPRTGVCKNTLEPGDTNIDNQCQECDSCVWTLLHDLEKLDDELARLRAQLENASASSLSRERLDKLEKAVTETKLLVKEFSSTVNAQKNKVNQLEDDTTSLADDISSLKKLNDIRAADADKALDDVDKTHKRAKDLESDIQKMLKKIQDLLNQMKKEEGRGDSLPSESLLSVLEKAQRMVKDMEERNFTPQKLAAEKEKEEAQKLLDYIKTNISRQSDQNEAAAEKIRSLLKIFNSKLRDLDKALKEATEMVKKANSYNGLSAQTLEDLQKRVEDLREQRKTVENQIATAEDSLQKTVDLIKELSDSKMEYETLAAQLDGAKSDLTTKVKKITNAAAQKDIVEAAEEHANNLAKLAKDLENAVKNASGRSEVRDARDSIEAYQNITDAINAAEAAANEAKEAADNALKNVQDQSLTQRAKDLKQTGNDLLKGARDDEKQLQDAAKNITDLNKRLKKAEKKKKALEKDLRDAQTKLNDTKRDDIKEKIEEAKRKAAAVNETTKKTMEKLNNISNEINKINISPSHSNLSNELKDMNQSVNQLLKIIPSLNDKIAEVENVTAKFPPTNNISDSIKNVKELIEQARDAANRITIPMNFKGDGYVELRPPKDLDDLKAYTSLSLKLQRPLGRGDGKRRRRQAVKDEDMFVMYLGKRDSSKNYIGMVLRKSILYTVYKLNSVEYELKSSYVIRSASEPAKFDRVDLHRVYQDAEIIYTSDVTSNTPGQPVSTSSQGTQNKDLLNISPSDVVFYVGGYPANFTPPASLNLPKYQGCLELISFNDKVVSLYNFQKAERINPEIPCKRYLPPVDSDYYEGTGYGKVALTLRSTTVLVISMSVRARSENGILFYIGTEDKYFTLTMERGVLFIRSNLLEDAMTDNKRVSPMTDWTDIQIIVKTNIEVQIRVTSSLAFKTEVKFNIPDFQEFYVGGIPQGLREKNNITMQPFLGCIKNLKVFSDFQVLQEQVGVSKGCPVESLILRKAQFSLGSSLSSNLPGFSLDKDLTLSLGFKSKEPEGLILQDKLQAYGISLGLENGHVILIFDNKELKSNYQYKDGEWHYLTITKNAGIVGLHIDDNDFAEAESGSRSVTDTGGLMFVGNKKFKGCISNFYTRRPENLYRVEDFSNFNSSGDILMGVCTNDNPIQLMLDRNSKRDGVTPVMNETAPACALPAQVQNAYRVGGAGSSLSYSLPLQVLQPRPHFSLDVRTRSAEGLLFFAATRGGRSHLVLYMSKGRIRLSVGKQKEIFNREKYNDGRWHSVIFTFEKRKFRLVVDGIRAQDGQLSNAELKSMQEFMSPVFLGSAPESFHKELKSKDLPKHSVSGCLRNFKMNGALMSNPTTNTGAGPCFEGQTQRGVYFSGNGAHVILNDSFTVSSTFELLFNIRPRSQTGLLLYVGDSGRNQYDPTTGHFLTVYMLKGEVVAKVNNGRGEFMVSVKPKTSLCDGVFHKISVIKRLHVVQLSVDTMDNYKIGPPTSTPILTKSPLFLGGIPGTLTQNALSVTSSFMGCIQDMTINDKLISFSRLSAVFGPVNLKECPG